MLKWMLTTCCLALIYTLSFAQTTPVKWTFSKEKVRKNEFNIILTAKIDDTWAIYSQELDGDGPIPTSIEFKTGAGIELIGKPKEKGDRIEGFDDIFGMNVIKYKKEVQFIQLVRIKKPTTISGSVTFMSCNNETCLPPKATPFSVQLK